MDEVSANGVRQLVALLGARGLPRTELLRDVRLTAEDLRRPRGRVSWSDLVTILERAAERLGGPEAMEEVGAQHTARPVFGWFPAMARAAISPRDLYWLGKCYGHSVFRNVPCKHEVLSSSRIRQTLTIPPEDRDCPAFFHLMRGVLRSTTCLIGLPEARVDMEIAPRRAVYTVTLPRSMSLPARLLRKLRFSRFALREVNRPGFAGGSIPWEDWSHGTTEPVFRGGPRAGGPDVLRASG